MELMQRRRVMLLMTKGDEGMIITEFQSGSATWSIGRFPFSFSSTELEVVFDMSSTTGLLNALSVSVGTISELSVFNNDNVIHIYSRNDLGYIRIHKNKINVDVTVADATNVVVTFKASGVYVDGAKATDLPSGFSSKTVISFGSTEGSNRFNGTYKSIKFKQT